MSELAAVAEPIEVVDVPEVDTPEQEVAEVPEPVEEQSEPEEVEGDGRQIPAKWRALKESNPDLFKEYKSLFFTNKDFMSKLPGGPKEAGEILDLLQEYGGKDGVKGKFTELTQSVTKMAEIDQFLAEGNVKVLDMVTPESMSKLAPAMMAKWHADDEEGCNKTLCGVIANTHGSPIGDTDANLSMNLAMASKLIQLKQPEEAMSILQKIAQWSKGFGEMAQKPVTPKQQQAPQINEREQALSQREEQMWMGDMNTKAVAIRDPLVSKELAPYLKNQSKDEEAISLIKDTINNNVLKMLGGDQTYQKDFGAFVKAKNMDGAIKLFQAKYSALLPDVTQRVSRAMIGAPKPAPVVKATPAKPTPPRTTKPVDPWDQAFA